jgi:pyruvate dehydrogenase E1 component alpha subunit
LQEIDAKVRTEVDEATKLAKTDAEIGVEELSGDIYYNNVHTEIRGILPSAPLKHIEVVARN